MDTQSKQRPPWLFCAAALILLVLLVLPATGWLARSQMGMLVRQPDAFKTLLRDLGVKEMPGITLNTDSAPPVPPAAEKNDYGGQLAIALTYTPSENQLTTSDVRKDARLDRLRALAARFPDHRTAVLAHALRYASQGVIHVNRDAEVETYMSGKPYESPVNYKVTPPEALAAYDADAQTGENSDPTNAYFPLMRALGLFAAHRDAEGLEAVHRASTKPHFDDYTWDEAQARWQHMEAGTGRQPVQMRIAVNGGLLYPHFAQMRSVARLTAYKATQAEVSGHTQEGFAIRHDMMHLAGLMRVESRTAIGSLVGIAMFAIQSGRPGGEMYGGMTETAWKALSSEDRIKQRLETFCSYLTRIKHPEEATWVRSESIAGTETRAIISKGINTSPFSVDGMKRLLGRWVVTLILLFNTLEMLVLCGAILLLKALRRDTDRQPLWVVGTLCTLFLIIALRSEWAATMAGLLQVIKNLSGEDSNALPVAGSPMGLLVQIFAMSPVISRIVVIVLSLAVPCFTLAVLGLIRLVHGKSEPSVLVTGLARVGPAICLGLVLLYSVSLSFTLQEENRQTRAIEQVQQHEGRYFASVLGKQWPGLPR